MGTIVGPLRIGSAGASVKLVQEKLSIKADGLFGMVTDTAVRTYQALKRLEIDGVVGPATASSMGFAYQVGPSAWVPPRPPRTLPFPDLPVTPPSGTALAQLLEALAQSVASFGGQFMGVIQRFGDAARQVESMFRSAIGRTIGFIRGQLATLVGTAVERVAAVVGNVVRSAFAMVEQAIRQVASFLADLLGIDQVTAFLEVLIGRLRGIVNRVVDAAIQFLRGVLGPVETFLARVTAWMLEALAGLPV